MWPNLCRLIRPPIVFPFLVGRGFPAGGWLSGATSYRLASPGGGIKTQARTAPSAMSAEPTIDAGRPAVASKRRPELEEASAYLSDSKQKRLINEKPAVTTEVVAPQISCPGSEVAWGDSQVPADTYNPIVAAGRVRQKLRLSRRWMPTELGRLHEGGHLEVQKSDIVFRLMSYNILAQGLLEDNLYLYQHCRHRVLSWPQRRDNLLDEIRQADVDIMCLQELQEDHYEQVFKPELERLGYGTLYKRRTGDKHDGCGIFFRRSLFELELCQAVEFVREGVPVLDRDNVGLIALLKPCAQPSTDFRLCVATTHLLFNPRRGDIKLAQLCLLLAEIDRLASKGSVDGRPQYYPVILCGDMNSEPHSPLYSFLARGSLCYTGLLSGDVSGQGEGANRGKPIPLDDCLRHLNISDESRYNPDPPKQQGKKEQQDKVTSAEQEGSGCVSHGLNLVSVYQHVKHGRVPEVTTHHQRASCTVDYIFYTVKHKQTVERDYRVINTGVVEGPLKLLATYGLMSHKELAAVSGLPNEVQSSDHLPLIAKFLLRVPS